MPLNNMHLTALELTHSLTQPEITEIISNLGLSAIEIMTDYTYYHRARLIKPMLSYDGAALALSFLPAAGEGLPIEARMEKESKQTTNSRITIFVGISSILPRKPESRLILVILFLVHTSRLLGS
jgi:hypothetical protein